jgi:adenine-specific DNA-methyltransferase
VSSGFGGVKGGGFIHHLPIVSGIAYFARVNSNLSMTALEKAFEDVQQLVNTFNSNYNHYMSPGYSEAEARQDFIDNFFIALGWDVRHKHQTNPYEQDVKIEKSQKQQNESARKRADYAFFTAPNYKDEVFFAEAKKPSVLIESNPQHYFQTIKYGWNSGCPICVLTDFEEFVIIDCRQKPDLKYALNGKHKSYRYTDYTNKEKFAEIYWLFSREAVTNNSLQKYAAALPKPKGKVVQKALFKGGYQAIDDSFLEYIDGIRENIAKAFKKHNEELNSEQLTEATQRTVDRLVFIRFLEDKFIEADEHVSEWQSWKDFITDCRKLDAKYNGVVFKKHFIDEPNFLGADEKLFLDICSDISNLNSPYDFNYIPIHILGSIYERFLGKIVRATDKRVFIEEKPEVRKAGGVYYTPKYIVDYIVKNTVGKIIDGLAPKQIAEKRFADIACGSGSFLIGVYDYLLDYHKKYYTEKLKDKTELTKSSEDFSNTDYKDGQWILTLKLKQEILLNNIYGVDIDGQAVEVTQLSLFLKMLEEENVSSTATKQGALFSKVLPDLSKNIVCGNSLIGFDIMNGQLFEDDELKKLNPMDYETAFPAIMRNGGFDAVVGNPPWGAEFNENSLMYIRKKFASASSGNFDSYAMFLEKALGLLNKNGAVGYITPDTFLRKQDYIKLREKVLISYTISEMIETGPVFSQVRDTWCAVYFIQNSIPKTSSFIEHKKISRFIVSVEERLEQFRLQAWDEKSQSLQKIWAEQKDYIIGYKASNEFQRVINKMEANRALSELISLFKISRGEEGSKFNIKESDNGDYYMVIPEDVERYQIDNGKKIVSIGLAANKITSIYSHPKIWIIRIQKMRWKQRIVCSVDSRTNSAGMKTLQSITSPTDNKVDLMFLQAILSSKLINFWCENYLADDMNQTYLSKIPIAINEELKNQLVSLVTQMLESKKQLATAVTDSDKNFLQNKCSSIDRQIDKLVYELYGLTDEEIKIVEG